MKEIGKSRRSQVLTNCGPGSIIDFRGESGAPISVVAAGLEMWDAFSRKKGVKNDQVAHHSRLEKRLRVQGFRLPPIGKEGIGNSRRDRVIPSYRFPSWHNCPVCNLLQPHNRWSCEIGNSELFCNNCSKGQIGKKINVLPVNFVVTCRRGHLAEFPWMQWINHKANCNHTGKLKLISRGAGLKGLIVKCLECNNERSLDGALTPRIFDELKHKCFGFRPWFGRGKTEDCPERPIPIHRGASNVYFPVTISALDVPPWGDELEINLGDDWNRVKGCNSIDEIKDYLKAARVLDLWPDPEETIDNLAEKISVRIQLLDSNIDIRVEEYQKFHTDPKSEEFDEDHPNFKITRQEIPPEFEGVIGHLITVERLREVRVLRGFTRILPFEGNESDADFAPLSEGYLNWLPAIEVFGEGIFISLDEDAVKKWELIPEIVDRADYANSGYIENWRNTRKTSEPPPLEISPRFLLAHTLSHALATRLSIDSGYSTASIRERLYVSSNDLKMCGFLLYTSSPDSEGTLGGLSRQGRTERIFPVINAALHDMKWCSSDPLCAEGLLSLAEGSKLAACHSCAFVPETTCEFYNRHLDRTMLIGTPEQPELGYFGEFLTV